MAALLMRVPTHNNNPLNRYDSFSMTHGHPLEYNYFPSFSSYPLRQRVVPYVPQHQQVYVRPKQQPHSAAVTPNMKRCNISTACERSDIGNSMKRSPNVYYCTVPASSRNHVMQPPEQKQKRPRLFAKEEKQDKENVNNIPVVYAHFLTDVMESEQAYKLWVELPGATAEEVVVSLARVKVQGLDRPCLVVQRKQAGEILQRRYLLSGDVQEVCSELRNGVLSVVLSKQQQHQQLQPIQPLHKPAHPVEQSTQFEEKHSEGEQGESKGKIAVSYGGQQVDYYGEEHEDEEVEDVCIVE